MFKVNPYRPGAGLMPTYLAGRDSDISEIENLFEALRLNIPTQSVIFSGLRGVGKTVLINRLQEIAEEKDIFDSNNSSMSDAQRVTRNLFLQW